MVFAFIYNRLNIHLSPQVLFTADLKSFSSYGLKPPSSALPPSNPSIPEECAEKHLDLQIPPVTVSPLKRKWNPELGDPVDLSPANIAEHCLEDAETWNVDDRVKKRR